MAQFYSVAYNGQLTLYAVHSTGDTHWAIGMYSVQRQLSVVGNAVELRHEQIFKRGGLSRDIGITLERVRQLPSLGRIDQHSPGIRD
jgi:hypothetical protein